MDAPACLPWPAGESRMIVAIAGSFAHVGNAADYLARFGAISAKPGLQCWSVSDKAWRSLRVFSDARLPHARAGGERGTGTIYGISVTSGEASALASPSEASYINRAIALYRYYIEP